jgi:hypothetical protein
MPLKTEDAAYLILNYLISLAPYGSGNMTSLIEVNQTFLSKLSQYNTLVQNSKNYLHVTFYYDSTRQQRATLKAEIEELANNLKITLNPDEKSYPLITVLNPNGNYKKWYEEAKKKYDSSLSVNLYADIINTIKKYEYSNSMKFFIECYFMHEVIKATKTGSCGELARAGIFYLLAETDYSNHIYHIAGSKIDHECIVLSMDEIPAVFSIDDLAKNYPDALMVDPWLRCKFLAKDANEYFKIFSRPQDRESSEPLKFFLNNHITAKQISQFREFYKNNDFASLFDKEIEEFLKKRGVLSTEKTKPNLK